MAAQGPVDGDASEREYAGDDDNALDVVGELAERLAQRPLVLDVEEQLERHVNDGDQRVADGQRDEEHVRHGPQFARRGDDGDDEQVAADRRDDHDDVDQDEQGLHLLALHNNATSRISTTLDCGAEIVHTLACKP